MFESTNENGRPLPVMSESNTAQPIRVRGYDLIRDPLLNKGTAFTPRERSELGLHGLLPNACSTMEEQAQRIYASLNEKTTAMEKYIGLVSLQDRNEHLFYRVLCDHLEELLPIIYTPTVGSAAQNFSRIFRRGRGVWLTPDLRGQAEEVLRCAAGDREVRLLVVTDGESILGIGDQGAGGMAISVGKLALYTAGAGIHPNQTLPVTLDVGTDNQALFDDEFYLGWRQPRLRGARYAEFMEEFVTAVQAIFPGALIQWEDFRKDNALTIMERYRTRVPSFNDDIQGTGAVALAGLLSAMRITDSNLAEQRIVIFGAGAAGLGIARQFRVALTQQGVNSDQLVKSVAVLDSGGLLVDDRQLDDDYKRELAWPRGLAAEVGLGDSNARDLAAVVAQFRPTALVGSSGQPGAFTEAIVRGMAKHCERPVILPFSNPTNLAEAIPEDIVRWTGGRALIATGSPFEPVTWGEKTIQIGQGNNVFIFPGLGLGALLSGATQVTESMIGAAAHALADTVTDEELATGLLFPAISRLRDVSARVAKAVIDQAVQDGVNTIATGEDGYAWIEATMWEPDYRDYTAA